MLALVTGCGDPPCGPAELLPLIYPRPRAGSDLAAAMNASSEWYQVDASGAVSAGSARGTRYGELMAIAGQRGVVDWPGFAMRGVIEGFYGPPWTIDERRQTLRRMARLRMNTYLYGPKDDPYHRVKWAEPYPDEVARQIADAAREAAKHEIDFIWSVSPGYGSYMYEAPPETSIEYGSTEAFATLTRKIEQVRALGVTRIALFLDDVKDELPHAADRARYATLVDAQIDLVNRLQQYLGTRLLFVGTRYTELMPGWQDYNRALGAGLDANVDVMWTGPLIFSDVLTPAKLAEIDGYLKRKVILWDNWPPLLRAPEGRSPDLPLAAGGILSNAVLSEGAANPIGDFWQVLGPIADYAWNPESYQAASSFATWRSLDVDLCR
jgi:hyaluronoglucosaminidase